MIEYNLKDRDGNLYSLNGGAVSRALKDSWTQGEDLFSYDSKIINKTFLPGATLVGSSRLASREFTLMVESTDPVSTAYRAEVNELLEFLSRTKYLVDVTNDMQIEIVTDSISIGYDPGGLKKISHNQISFTALTPYWEALTLTTVTGAVLADTIKEVAISNTGFVSSPPLITLVTTAAVISVQAYLTGNQYGIRIDDSLFGTTGNLTMIIDCVNGEITINDINRNASIIEGTGFFSLTPGIDTLNLLCADQDVNYTIDFYSRYFV